MTKGPKMGPKQRCQKCMEVLHTPFEKWLLAKIINLKTQFLSSLSRTYQFVYYFFDFSKYKKMGLDQFTIINILGITWSLSDNYCNFWALFFIVINCHKKDST